MEETLLHLALCTAVILAQAARVSGQTETPVYDKTIDPSVQFVNPHIAAFAQ
jgi:hypothetical protein